MTPEQQVAQAAETARKALSKAFCLLRPGEVPSEEFIRLLGEAHSALMSQMFNFARIAKEDV